MRQILFSHLFRRTFYVSSSLNPSKIMFRQNNMAGRYATKDDFKDVLALRNEPIYHGMDYIPAVYHRYLSDPSARSLILELNGGILMYAFAVFVDDGNAYLMGGGRIREGFAGQRLAVFGFAFMDHIVAKEMPLCKRFYGITRRHRSIDDDPRITFMMEKTRVDFSTSFDDLHFALKQRTRMDDSQTKLVGDEAIFDDTAWWSRVLPKYFSVAHEMFGLYRSNFTRILAFSRALVTTPNATVIPNCLGFVTTNPLLGPHGNGWRCDLDFYGDDYEALLDQLFSTLDLLVKSGNAGALQLRIGLMEKSSWKNRLRNYGLKELGFSRGLEDHVEAEARLFVRDLRRKSIEAKSKL